MRTIRSGSRIRRLSLVATAAIAGLLLAGCSSPQSDGGPDEVEELTTVRVAFNPGTAVQLYAALAHDLFTKHGLDVKLVQFESGAAANAAYASGDLDLGYSGIPGAFAARLASGNTRVFMIDNEGWKAEGLVAGNGTGIRGVADLEGKKVGTVIGTTSWMALMTALEAEGVDPAAVDIQNVGPTAWVPALENGDVDAIWGWAPLIFTMEEAGGELVATSSEYLLNPLLWQVRGPFMDENPEAVQAFIAAYDEAAEIVESRDPKFIAKMQELTGVDEEKVLRTVDSVKAVSVEEMVDPSSPYSFTSKSGLQAILDKWLAVLTENKILQEKPDFNGFIDPSALEGYLAQG